MVRQHGTIEKGYGKPKRVISSHNFEQFVLCDPIGKNLLFYRKLSMALQIVWNSAFFFATVKVVRNDEYYDPFRFSISFPYITV